MQEWVEGGGVSPGEITTRLSAPARGWKASPGSSSRQAARADSTAASPLDLQTLRLQLLELFDDK